MKLFRELIYFFTYWFLRGIICLRYRVKIQGLGDIKKDNPEAGILFLPNHPAEIDPIMLIVLLWRTYRTRPLVIQYFFEMKGILPFMKLVRALALPNMNGTANQWKRHQIDKLFQSICSGVRKGENFMIYPSGRLKLEAEEVIGGSSLVHSLLQEYPEMNIVLVRTRGLWGSLFSRALTGKVPPFGAALGAGLKTVLKNGIFFAPRRVVTMEFQSAPKDLPITKPRLEFNRYLEEWYNVKPDPLKLVSYTFWKETLPKVKISSEGRVVQIKRKVSKEVRYEVATKLATIVHKKVSDISSDKNLWTDLGIDSLDMSQVHTFLEDSYNVEGLAPGELETVEDVMQAAVGRKKILVEPEREKIKRNWPKEKQRAPIESPRGETIQEAFLRTCDRMGKATACSDGIMEICLSYQKLKTVVLALSLEIKRLEGERIGIMLPCSVGAYICILATLLAKKIPVMLNWTVGSRSLDHAAEVTNLSFVLTARRFLERLENVDLGQVEEKLILLEEFRKRLTLSEKIKAFFLSKHKVSTLIKKLGLDQIKHEDTAVVLFTSGTEALPKGVPLSHGNILSNQKASVECLEVDKNDILYAVLPPFHSFGFTVTGLMPLLIGMKVCFSPDPTDGKQMAADVAHWNVTFLCAAPIFLLGMFHFADKKQLKSIRFVMSGAEKAPQALFDHAADLPNEHVELLEGYGITECSPVVTSNRPHSPPRGVGKPLSGVELCMIDPETEEVLEQGQDGEVCIAGPNVFAGYLGINIDPFIEIAGKKWYRSGDRGHIDEKGNLILSGRLKRFVKMGGEMIGLNGVESEIQESAREKGWIADKAEKPILALSAKEKEGEKPQLILYSTCPLEKDKINEALREKGMSRLIKITEIRIIKEIPLTATGKVQYRKLDEIV